MPFRAQHSKKTYHSFVTNPPFGMRVKGKGCLVPLYQSLGHAVHRLAASGPRSGRGPSAAAAAGEEGAGEAEEGAEGSGGWGLSVLAHDARLARRTGVPGLRASFRSSHGGLSVTALHSPPHPAWWLDSREPRVLLSPAAGPPAAGPKEARRKARRDARELFREPRQEPPVDQGA